MNVTDIKNEIKQSLSATIPSYTGDQDESGIRNGYGKQQWNNKWIQKYNGQFYQDSLHCNGTYEWIYNKQKYVYSGKIYANNIEGYGLFSYPDGSTFEGLFKYNQRYGPGVFTYVDGTQDIGIWTGLNLVRLSSDITADYVPNLASSLQARAYLVMYKKLISLVPDPYSEADKILINLNASDELIKRSSELCNQFIRDAFSRSFDKNNYDAVYFSDENRLEDIIITFEDGVPVTKEIVATDILAWNNEESDISIMKHTFLNRHYEHTVSFSVHQILSGIIEDFRMSGCYENVCLEFLYSCCEGNHKNMSKLITSYDLNPDVCDILGNSGIHCASSHDHLLAIKVLVNFGANINRLNDQNLTSLILCLLRYIAVKYNITDWEKAFLPPIFPETHGDLWHPYLYSGNETKTAEHDRLRNVECYILDIQCKHPIVVKAKKKQHNKARRETTPKSAVTKTKKNKVKDSTKHTSIEIQAEIKRIEMEEKLNNIYKTILLLLFCGADPNYGLVPLPPLILSIFTKDQNIVSEMIKHNADCNIRTSHHDGSLTALHILASLKPSQELSSVAEVLLSAGANPNLRANTEHWLEEKKIIQANLECDDEGKTPLQLLCMRYDFANDLEDHLGTLFDAFVNGLADLSLYYLGHTCLTLAMLRGNVNLMRKILQTKLVDPNQHLGNNMGIPLTVLILKRYMCLLPTEVSYNVYNTLYEYNANPFSSLPEFLGNAIDFCEEENKPEKPKIKKKLSTAEKKCVKIHRHIINCLNNIANKVLERHIQGLVVKYLYEYKIECDFSDPIFNAMKPFVNVIDTVRIVQIMINNDLINFTTYGCYSLLKFVAKKSKKKKDKHRRKAKSKSENSAHLQDIVGRFKKGILTNMETKNPCNLPLPEIDPDEDKYIVCFTCYQKLNKELVLCPNCELVYFCSEYCNRLCLKNPKSKHKCKGVFYNSERKKMLERLKRGEVYQTKLMFFKGLRDVLISDPDYQFNLKFFLDGIGDEGKGKKSRSRSKKRDGSGSKKKKKGHKDDKRKGKKKHESRKDAKSKRGKRDKSSKRSKSTSKDKSKSRGESSTRKYRGDSARDKEDVEDRPSLADKTSDFLKEMEGILELLRLNKMFPPCCIFIDGQLYYKFEGQDAYCGLTYSSV